MCISANQLKKKEMARREAIENTMDVCATGEKHKYNEYDNYGNQINNE